SLTIWAKQYSLQYKVNLTLVPTLLGNWIQLNTDDAIIESSSIATIGSVIRDKNGSWIFRYNQFVGICSILNAELWTILEGLGIALDRGFDSMIILSDSLETIQAIQDGFAQ
ncbi:hypothetical protein Golax_009051, partial [Gossypium laxum]|nr:hypothetical protein [Gossypium laxum]